MNIDKAFITLLNGTACAVYKPFPGIQSQAIKAMRHDRQALALPEGRNTRVGLQRAAGG